MSNIVENLRKILTARYGRDVRQSIHDAIHDCYEDGRAGATDIVAREMIADVEAQIAPATTEKAGTVKPDGNTITVDADGTIHSQGGGASTWSEISSKPFESIGSGLDVSDGVLNAGDISNRINYFINSDKRANVYEGDLNNIDVNSIYTVNPNCPNAPIGCWGFVQTFVFGFDAGFRTQIYTTMNLGQPQLYTRECIGNNWGDWKQTAITNQISDAYNPSTTYAQEEFCIYNNTLWKSKVNNNTGNTPTEGSYWTATNCGAELNKRPTIKTYIATFTTNEFGIFYWTDYPSTKIVPIQAVASENNWMLCQTIYLNDAGIGFRVTDAVGNVKVNVTLRVTIFYVTND